MPQNFLGQNLRGRSFKGQDLSGANFASTDIRGADFTNALLIGANFKGAKAGLQQHWVVGLIVCSWLLTGLSGYFSIIVSVSIIYILDPANQENFTIGIGSLTTLVIFFTVIFRKGLVVGAVALGGAVALSLGGALALGGALGGALVVTVGGTLAGVGVVGGALGGAVALSLGGALGGAVALALGGAVALSLGGAGVGAGVGAVALALTLINAYIGWRSWAGDEKYASIRSFAVAFAAIGGTSFRGADLTDADFTSATLSSTDFRESTGLKDTILLRTCWHEAKMLNRIRPGKTYLQDTELLQLLVTGQGQGKNFNGRHLRGLNLSGANLVNANFIGTDFYQSSLKEADLTGSWLVRTQFESTDLTGAILTEACIEDWVITKTTKLSDVKCKYVFTKFSKTGHRRDPVPTKGEFKNDDFILYVQSVLDTIKLYHEHDVNPKLALQVLQSLSEDYQCTLEVVKYEKRGNGGVILELKISGSLNQEKLKETYYEKYDQYLKLYMNDPKNELKSPINLENVTVYKGNLIAGNVIDSNVTYATEGGTIMPNMSHSPGSFSVSGSVGGNVDNVQGNNNRTVQGDNNQLTQQNQVGGGAEASLTKENIVKLLTELETLIHGAEIPAEPKQEAIEDLSATKNAADKEEPNKTRALARLNSVAETLEKTSKTVDSGKKLWSTAKPIIVKLAGWLGAAAGSHLLGL